MWKENMIVFQSTCEEKTEDRNDSSDLRNRGKVRSINRVPTSKGGERSARLRNRFHF